jgi:ribosomal protein S26
MVATSRRARTADPYRDTDVVDERAPRFNQGAVALLAALSLLTGQPWPAAIMGAQLAVGLVFGRRYCLPCVFYFEVVQPRVGEGRVEDARPPRFANLLGAAFLIGASVAHAAGLHALGWTLVALVAALATLAVVTGFCVGCSMYRVISRLRGIRPGHHDRVDAHDFGISSESVVQFTHPLCSDCRTLEQSLRAAGNDLVVVDVTEHPDLARKYHVDVVPLALRVTSEGRVLERVA